MNEVTLFLIVWATLVILFFCFSTTQEYYTMPSYPAFALLIGSALAKAENRWREGKDETVVEQRARLGLRYLGLLVFVAGAFAFWFTRNISVDGGISETLSRNPDAYALSLGHVLDLTPTFACRTPHSDRGNGV